MSDTALLEPPNKATQPSNASSGDESMEVALTEIASAGIPDRVLASLRRRALDIYHHRPGRLWVSVNGIPVASLDVCNQQNSLKVTTMVAEPLQFIEVFSEQQIRLAMLNANPEGGNRIESETNISLSEKRRLEVGFVEQDSNLSIRLGYTDPQMEGWTRLAALGILEIPQMPETA